MERSTHTKLTILAIYQLVGGLLGLVLTGWVLYQNEMLIDQAALRMGLFAAGLFIFSVLCARMLWRNPRRGLILSIVNQVLQVVYFSFGAYGFQYVAGLRVGMGVDMIGGWVFKFRMAVSSFNFTIGSETGEKFIGINLVALFLIFWMEQLLEQIKE